MLKRLSLIVLLGLTGCTSDIKNERGAPGEKGEQGTNGKDGEKGNPGEPGESCTVEKIEGKTKLSCANGSVFILDGAAGESGTSCQVVAFEEHPQLKAIRCNNEYMTLVNDASFFGYCIDASASAGVKKTVKAIMKVYEDSSPNEERAQLCQRVSKSLESLDNAQITLSNYIGGDPAPLHAAYKNLRNLDAYFDTDTIDAKIKLAGFANVKQLNISVAGAKIEQGAFAGLTNVTELRLSYAAAMTLEADTFRGLTNLRTLKISTANVSTSNPPKPLYINRQAFNGLDNLNLLLLTETALTGIESGAFEGLTQLTYLDLSKNKLQGIVAGTFSGLKKIATLNMSNGEISAINIRAFEELGTLKELNLGYNKLTTIPAGLFFGLSGLNVLKLYSNGISKLDDDAFLGLGELKVLEFGGNFLKPTESAADVKAFKPLINQRCVIDLI